MSWLPSAADATRFGAPSRRSRRRYRWSSEEQREPGPADGLRRQECGFYQTGDKTFRLKNRRRRRSVQHSRAVQAAERVIYTGLGQLPVCAIGPAIPSSLSVLDDEVPDGGGDSTACERSTTGIQGPLALSSRSLTILSPTADKLPSTRTIAILACARKRPVSACHCQGNGKVCQGEQLDVVIFEDTTSGRSILRRL